MKTQKRQFGDYGEEIACKYLRNKNYKIIDRNYQKPWGEIDTITIAPDKTLVFIEVKTLRSLPYFKNSATKELRPEDQLTAQKLKRIQKTALLYAGENSKLINEDRGWRIDLIAVTIAGDDYKINHYENI